MRRSIQGRGTRTLLATLTAGAALALAACGSGDSAAGSSQSAGGGALKESDSPLHKWYESHFASSDSGEQMKAQQKKAEEWTATCMQEQGFTYIPVASGMMGDSVIADEEDGPDMSSKEWAAQNGYGFFITRVDSETAGGGGGPVDPNQAAMDAMSESERTAYETALYGDQTGIDWNDPNLDYKSLTDKQKGCSGRAMDAVPVAGSDVWESDEWKSLSDDVDKLQTEFENGATLTEPNAKWADCMANAGYAGKGWTKPSDPENFYREASDKMWQDAAPNAQQPDPSTTDQWKKSAEEEKDSAVADATCRDSTGYTQAMLKARFAAEKEFMDTHKEQMDAIDAMFEGSAN